MHVKRRTLLGSLSVGVGSGLVATLGRRLIAEAANAPAIKRLVIVVCGGGMLESNYTCKARSETDFDLSPIFQPLEPWRRDLLIASKFYSPYGKGLHGDEYSTLTGLRGTGDLKASEGPSLDRFLAKRIGGNDPFSSINLGLWETDVVASLNRQDPAPNCSMDGLAQPNPTEPFPDRAFARLFGDSAAAGSLPTAAGAEQLRAEDKSVLDFSIDEVTRLQARLAAPERARLDQYLTSLRELEVRQLNVQAAAPTSSCSKLAAPHKYTTRDLNDLVVDEHVDDQIGVLFNALACGRTRIATLMMHGRDSPHNRYMFMGDTEGYHKHCHAGRNDWIVKINTYWTQKVAKLWGLLHTVPEGGGTMADNTLLMYMNCGGGAHHGGSNRHAIVLLGSLGGAFKTGRYLQYPNMKYSTADLFTAVANAMGVPIDRFGDPALGHGPPPGLSG